ncbi:MAG: flagellar biosynthetic protein FliP [Magnetococcales bacterium]|nr:flagellar biosynthetic protein FliP [Magnetococcales bacterium]|tara:strand:+ start:2488 stop:3261 length:774 start_codon:yes stop_codon:yes gene_type:complete
MIKNLKALHGYKLLAFLFTFIVVPSIAFAQQAGPLNINVGDDLLSSQRLFQMIILLTVLSLAPSILIMLTSFTRLIIVFSFTRSALGLQNTPPNSVLVSLALFLTAFIMQPTFEEAYKAGISPYLEEEINEEQAFERSINPFKAFMGTQVSSEDLELFIGMMPERDRPEKLEDAKDAPLRALIPAFMISELKRAFEIGFLLFLPFLVIDLTVASILMSMGMMMLPPVIVSLPFKIIFFVLVDGWHLLSGSLVQSFGP